MRDIKFSTKFPAYHPRAGEPTNFIEKLWAHFYPDGVPPEIYEAVFYGVVGFEKRYFLTPKKNHNPIRRTEIRYERSPNALPLLPKLHTIRRGKRWKAGDYANLKVWSGAPYRSKPIIIVPEAKIMKVYDFWKNGNLIRINKKRLIRSKLFMLAQNDGLSVTDMMDWFNVPTFEGQVLCFDENVKY